MELETVGNQVLFNRLLSHDVPLFLDGANGTELERRGVTLTLPLWSAAAIYDHPELIQEIHRDYLSSGAHLLTANTFRTSPYALRNTLLAGKAQELTRQAVNLARQAIQTFRETHTPTSHRPLLVAGSMAPLEDCYRPERVPSASALHLEHRKHAENLADAGVDFILVETQNNLAEAQQVTAAALATGKPVWISFLCQPTVPLRFLSGEPLKPFLHEIQGRGVQAILLNCCAAPVMNKLVEELKVNCIVPWGIYANTAALLEDGTWQDTPAVQPDRYADCAEHWQQLGASILGGCCGTTPDHLQAVVQRFQRP
ncbi:Homocysteine S-methyltransferase [Planctomycetales bacterium 10988]|nr:Homocysteine S-methyltransferase [Planctomycetales bacterium 10988]